MGAAPIRALLIEDDLKYANLLKDYLEPFGFSLELAENAAAGLAKISDGHDIVLLDMMLPDGNGLDILRDIRQSTTTPVVILSAQNEEANRIVGLEMGADDYVPKAFSPRELLARLRAVLRRTTPTSSDHGSEQVNVAGLFMDRGTMTARIRGNNLELTVMEFRILFRMAGHPGRVFTREHLLELAGGRELSPYDRSVDMHISSLRRKLCDDPHHPAYLKTVRGLGYTFINPQDIGASSA